MSNLPYPKENDGATHWEQCYLEKGHHNCAVREIERLTRERDNWINSAREYSDGLEYYRGLVVQIGEAIGEQSHIADDGVQHPDVLCAKVPELVARLRAENERLTRELERYRWISVYERLPKEHPHRNVFIYVEGRDKNGPRCWVSRQTTGLPLDEETTHWREIDAPE